MISEIDATQSKKDTFNDWIEVYNATDEGIDLSNWMIKDNKDEHEFMFPEGTSIAPRSFLVIAEDSAAWVAKFGKKIKVIGNLSFGINKNKDKIRLYDATQNKVDEINLKKFGSTEEDNMNWSKSDLRIKAFNPNNWKLEKPTPGVQSTSFTLLLKKEEEDRYWKSVFFYSGISLGTIVVLLFLFPLLRRRKRKIQQ